MPKRKKSDSDDFPEALVQNLETDMSEPAAITKKIRKIEGISWPDHDVQELVARVEKNIPASDTLTYQSRLDRLNWEQIAFKSRTVKDCQQVWGILMKKVRKFRLLDEIVDDIKKLLHVAKPSRISICQHADKPKQPPNSFIFYIEDKRVQVSQQNPQLKPSEVYRKLGTMFKQLPPEEKAIYDERARKAKTKYIEKMQVFYSKHPELLPKNKNKKPSTLAQGGPPAKPKTPFELFLNVEAERQGVTSNKFAFIQKCREQWSETSDEDKLFWIIWAEEQYEKYREDLKTYLKEHPHYEPENIKPVITRKEKKIKDKCSGKPEKPPRAGFHLFFKMMMEAQSGMDLKEAAAYVSEKWKSCTKGEKDEYKTRVEQMWEEYHLKLDEYLLTLPPEERDKVREESGVKKKQTVPRQEAVPREEKVKLKKPVVPPLSDYKYFLSKYNGLENPSEVWENMTEEERKQYEDGLAEERKVYIGKYERYLKSLSKEELQKLGQVMTDKYDTSSESDEDTDN